MVAFVFYDSTTELAVSRDHDGEHEPLIVSKHHKNLTELEEQIIAMYSKGITVRVINKMRGSLRVSRFAKYE